MLCISILYLTSSMNVVIIMQQLNTKFWNLINAESKYHLIYVALWQNLKK